MAVTWRMSAIKARRRMPPAAPRALYEALVDRLEDAEARAAYQRPRDEASRPDALPDRLPAGESPVRVWRLYRGLAALDLARRAGISKSCLSEIETAGKTGSVALLKRIAAC